MRRNLLLTAVLLVALVAGACSPGNSGGSSGSTTIMGTQRLTADDLAAWFASVKGTAHRLPASLGSQSVAVRNLAQIFIEEGADEGVRGDIAFAQSVLETGWFWFPDGGRVAPAHNNYAGIGAVDGGSTANAFATPRQGVRAQMQHLRAYADASVTAAKLAHPLVDPRFHLVSPKGKAPTWQGLSGTWASSTTYGSRILELFSDAARHVGKSLTPARSTAANPAGGHYVLFGDGTVEARGGAPDFGDKAFGFDIARDLAVMPDGQGYVLLDGFRRTPQVRFGTERRDEDAERSVLAELGHRERPRHHVRRRRPHRHGRLRRSSSERNRSQADRYRVLEELGHRP
ncbi:MAG: glucosaminidase domain-containing protein [Acidimicrobiia bacterium]|nr:glucosaminidase domain-containing protein [Acidimicrobiia bacterium]